MPRERRCLKCQDRPLMVRTQVDQVEADVCPTCHGLWLDQDELFRLAEQSSGSVEMLRNLVEAGAGSSPRSSDKDARPGEPCLNCGRTLSRASVGSFHIEHCTSCGGVFLDRGELDQVLAVASEKGIATVVGLAKSIVASGTLGK